jgi:hypothetical protein
MNKFDTLVSESGFAVLIAGTPALDSFVFLPLDAPTDDAVTAAARAGHTFVGVVGVVVRDKQFVPRSELAVELPVDAQEKIVDSFCALFERAIKHIEGTLWLQKLHDLPDMRDTRAN